MSFVVPDELVLVADGGLATELEARGNDLSDSLWSARLLMDAPDQVREAHLAFFRAGAVIATSASYQASFEGFARRGLGRRDAAGLMRRSVDLARAARAEVAGDGLARWVAASVGPYGAVLADGSEYRGRYGLSVRELAAWHRPRIEVLAEAGPDMLALETVPDVDEAEALMAAIAGLGIPAWLSYSIAGERTCAGQSLPEAFAVAAGAPEVVAVGVNCCAPADVLAAIAAAREVTGKPVIAYPNSGEGWDARRRAWTGQSRYSAGQLRQWITAGVRIAGGCCRIRPADIAVIAQAAADVGHAPAGLSCRGDGGAFSGDITGVYEMDYGWEEIGAIPVLPAVPPASHSHRAGNTVLGPDAGRAVGVRARSVKRPAAGGRHDAGLVPVPARQIAAVQPRPEPVELVPCPVAVAASRSWPITVSGQPGGPGAPGVSRRSLLNTGATFRSAPLFFDLDLTGRKPACVQPDAGYVGGRRREATACGWGDAAAGVDTCDVMSFSSL